MANKEGKLICRRATHAGSWYQSDGKLIINQFVSIYGINLSIVARSLDKELTNWLSQADISHSPARAIISPYPLYALTNIRI